MAALAGKLWEYNLAKVLVIDVTQDYELLQPPLPSEYYPVLKEMWIPCYQLDGDVTKQEWMNGFLYDWHQCPEENKGEWYIGVVKENVEVGRYSALMHSHRVLH